MTNANDLTNLIIILSIVIPVGVMVIAIIGLQFHKANHKERIAQIYRDHNRPNPNL